jgi:hypothetical protein
MSVFMQPIRYDVKELANAVKYYFRKHGSETVNSISKKFSVPVGTLNVHISNELKRKQLLKMNNRSIIFQGRMITVHYHYEFFPGLMSHPDSIEFEFHSIIYKGRNVLYILSIESLNEIEEMILELEQDDPSDEGPDPDYYYDMRKNGDI